VESAPAARDELAFRAARVLEMELGDAETAIRRYEAILARSPQHLPTLPPSDPAQ